MYLLLFLQGATASDSLLDFRNKFGMIHQSYTPNKEREFYSRLNTTALVNE